jgi:hypothetical protein
VISGRSDGGTSGSVNVAVIRTPSSS